MALPSKLTLDHPTFWLHLLERAFSPSITQSPNKRTLVLSATLLLALQATRVSTKWTRNICGKYILNFWISFDHHSCNTGQTFDALKLTILEYFQIIFVTRVHVQCCLHWWSHKSRPYRDEHLLRVHRYFRSTFIVSESVFHILNEFSHVLSVSRGMLNRIPSGFCISFFPGPHLRVSRAFHAFRVTRRILSHRFALSWNETTSFCFHRWWTGRRAFLRSFRHFRLLSCGKKRMAIGRVAAGKCGVVHDVCLMQQVVPLITRETALC